MPALEITFSPYLGLILLFYDLFQAN